MLENGININQHVDICKGYFTNIRVIGMAGMLENGRFLTMLFLGIRGEVQPAFR